jgi:hypothetical protein
MIYSPLGFEAARLGKDLGRERESGTVFGSCEGPIRERSPGRQESALTPELVKTRDSESIAQSGGLFGPLADRAQASRRSLGRIARTAWAVIDDL